jgi:hypothetical protein
MNRHASGLRGCLWNHRSRLKYPPRDIDSNIRYHRSYCIALASLRTGPSSSCHSFPPRERLDACRWIRTQLSNCSCQWRQALVFRFVGTSHRSQRMEAALASHRSYPLARFLMLLKCCTSVSVLILSRQATICCNTPASTHTYTHLGVAKQWVREFVLSMAPHVSCQRSAVSIRRRRNLSSVGIQEVVSEEYRHSVPTRSPNSSTSSHLSAPPYISK